MRAHGERLVPFQVRFHKLCCCHPDTTRPLVQLLISTFRDIVAVETQNSTVIGEQPWEARCTVIGIGSDAERGSRHTVNGRERHASDVRADFRAQEWRVYTFKLQIGDQYVWREQDATYQ